MQHAVAVPEPEVAGGEAAGRHLHDEDADRDDEARERRCRADDRREQVGGRRRRVLEVLGDADPAVEWGLDQTEYRAGDPTEQRQEPELPFRYWRVLKRSAHTLPLSQWPGVARRTSSVPVDDTKRSSRRDDVARDACSLGSVTTLGGGAVTEGTGTIAPAVRASTRGGTPQTCRRARRVRHHRRPREGDDLPVAVPARGARAARLPDRRRRGRRLDDGAAHGRARASRSRAPASSSTSRCSTASRSAFRTSAATSRTPPPTTGSALRSRGRRARLLPRDSAVPVRHRRQGSGAAGLTKAGRVVVEKPFGHDPASAARGGRAPPAHRRVAALPDRPLPREDGARRDHRSCASRTRCWSRSGTGTTSSRCRSRWRRTSGSRTAATSTIPSARCATSFVNHLMQVVAAAAMEPPAGRGPRDAQGRARSASSARSLTADPAHYVRGQYDGYLDIDGVAPDSTTETYRRAAPRHRQLALVGRARSSSARGKRLPATQTEVRLVFKHAAPPRLLLQAATGAQPARDQARSVDRRPARMLEAAAATTGEAEQITLDMEFVARRAARARRRTRCCCTRR